MAGCAGCGGDERAAAPAPERPPRCGVSSRFILRLCPALVAVGPGTSGRGATPAAARASPPQRPAASARAHPASWLLPQRHDSRSDPRTPHAPFSVVGDGGDAVGGDAVPRRRMQHVATAVAGTVHGGQKGLRHDGRIRLSFGAVCVRPRWGGVERRCLDPRPYRPSRARTRRWPRRSCTAAAGVSRCPGRGRAVGRAAALAPRHAVGRRWPRCGR